jgi:hypothetical protein
MQMLLCYRPIDPECTCPKKAGVPVTCGADARRSEKGSSSFRGVVLGELGSTWEIIQTSVEPPVCDSVCNSLDCFKSNIKAAHNIQTDGSHGTVVLEYLRLDHVISKPVRRRHSPLG